MSVLVTTYYRNDALGDAIESALAQTHEPVEVVVVDDSGEGHAEPVVADHDVTYVAADENSGQIAAWNAGLPRCRGEFVQFLDDDDRLRPTKLETQLRCVDSTPGVGAVYSGLEWERGGTRLPDEGVRGDVLADVLTLDTSPCVTSTLLARRALLADAHPFAHYPAATDEILKIELARRTAFDYVTQPLVHRGQDGRNVSESMAVVEAAWQILDDYAHLYERHPPEVRARAVANTYARRGTIALEENRWSVGARLSLAYSLYRSPDLDRGTLALLVDSLGGRPAVRCARAVERTLGG